MLEFEKEMVATQPNSLTALRVKHNCDLGDPLPDGVAPSYKPPKRPVKEESVAPSFKRFKSEESEFFATPKTPFPAQSLDDFGPLVDAIKELMQSQGRKRLFRSDVNGALIKGRGKAGTYPIGRRRFANFKEYSNEAELAGVVRMGKWAKGDWIELQ